MNNTKHEYTKGILARRLPDRSSPAGPRTIFVMTRGTILMTRGNRVRLRMRMIMEMVMMKTMRMMTTMMMAMVIAMTLVSKIMMQTQC